MTSFMEFMHFLSNSNQSGSFSGLFALFSLRDESGQLLFYSFSARVIKSIRRNFTLVWSHNKSEEFSGTDLICTKMYINAYYTDILNFKSKVFLQHS